jgi:hypothetical protein
VSAKGRSGGLCWILSGLELRGWDPNWVLLPITGGVPAGGGSFRNHTAGAFYFDQGWVEVVRPLGCEGERVRRISELLMRVSRRCVSGSGRL